MNAQDFIYDEADEVEFKTRSATQKSGFKPGGEGNSNRSKFGRRGKSPKQFNGIHRRRTKKIRW